MEGLKRDGKEGKGKEKGKKKGGVEKTKEGEVTYGSLRSSIFPNVVSRLHVYVNFTLQAEKQQTQCKYVLNNNFINKHAMKMRNLNRRKAVHRGTKNCRIPHERGNA